MRPRLRKRNEIENMAEQLAHLWVNTLYINGRIEEKDKAIYFYSIQVFIEKLIGMSIIFLLAIWFGTIGETILFLLFFSAIRKHAGGFHAETFQACLFGTVGIYILYAKVISPFLARHMDINIALTFVALIVILVIGAVNHPNMGWSKKEHDDSKYITRVTAFIEFVSIVFFSYLKFEDSYILYMSFGLILSALLMEIGKALGQEVKES